MTHRHSLFTAALGAAILVSGCRAAESDGHEPDSAAAAAASLASRQRSVEAVVTRFGARMQTVSLLAPDSIVSAELREAYGALVTPELLAEWLARPAAAPGRRVSSPWPDSIHVQAVQPVGADEYEVTGHVLYVTSAERAHAGSTAESTAVRLRVRSSPDSSWRISAYTGPSAPSKT